VKRDLTAADYKFHDDPYLIPYNSVSKRDYIMSKDGGRQAARYILNKHPELFNNNLVKKNFGFKLIILGQFNEFEKYACFF
jgi:hypothetical protein